MSCVTIGLCLYQCMWLKIGKIGMEKQMLCSIKKQCEKEYQAATKAWNLRNMKQIQSGWFSLVAANNNRVLKILPPGHQNDYHRREAQALQLVSCSPKVYATRNANRTFLMQKIQSAQSLAQKDLSLHKKVKKLGEAVYLFQQSQAYVPDNFPYWSAFHILHQPKNRVNALLNKSHCYAQTIPTTKKVILHNDLHRANVLYSATQTYVIDPKPCVGPPEAETFGLQNILNQEIKKEKLNVCQTLEFLRPLIEIYAKACKLDSLLLLLWMRVRIWQYFALQFQFSQDIKATHLLLDTQISSVESLIKEKSY